SRTCCWSCSSVPCQLPLISCPQRAVPKNMTSAASHDLLVLIWYLHFARHIVLHCDQRVLSFPFPADLSRRAVEGPLFPAAGPLWRVTWVLALLVLLPFNFGQFWQLPILAIFFLSPVFPSSVPSVLQARRGGSSVVEGFGVGFSQE